MILINPTKDSQKIDFSRYAEDLREYTIGTDVITGRDFKLEFVECTYLKLDKKVVLILKLG